MTAKSLVLLGASGVVLCVALLGAMVARHSRASETIAAVSPTLASVERVGLSKAKMNSRVFENPTPFIPPQCYTATSDVTQVGTAASGQQGQQTGEATTHNPCYVCHNTPRRGNFIFDADLQLTYSFGLSSRTNPWTNLFVDRTAALDQISDDEILSYIRKSNYFSEGENLLAQRLRSLPAEWDFNENGRWDGFQPDARFEFDEEGFDRTADGGYTGWRAFAYHPFPGTFWPTNGSAGDVLIRLDDAFQKDAQGRFDLRIYKVNLAIIEALFQERDIVIEPVDEKVWGVDLDADGRLDRARKVAFVWNPTRGKNMHFVGQAGADQDAGSPAPAVGLFPKGTEVLHTVRYLDVGKNGVMLAPRLKELRYAQKVSYRNYGELEQIANKEAKEKREYPDRIRQLLGDSERGLFNGQGWLYQGFIEDEVGELRPQTVEETAFCMGCHGGVSQTRDGIFSFSRKVSEDAPQRGWFHWSQFDLSRLGDVEQEDGSGAYANYLRHNHAADEFRGNAEARDKFFDEEGQARAEAFAELKQNVATLLLPSRERALRLNKAYREVVREQSYTKGRDAVVAPAVHVHRQVEEDQPTGIARVVPPSGVVPPQGGPLVAR